VKRRDLVSALEGVGFVLVRHGAKHDVFGRGSQHLTVPRHRDVDDRLARKILKEAGLA
jgi:mRNA interferase HicA